jgi:hypothetical protein
MKDREYFFLLIRVNFIIWQPKNLRKRKASIVRKCFWHLKLITQQTNIDMDY